MRTIRPEQAADRTRVFEIESEAFGRSNEAALIDTLREAASPCVSLVAEEDGELIGHIFFSPVSLESDPTAPPMGALGPVGVEPPHQGNGVGGELVRAGLDACAAIGWKAVFLVGNPAYYGRFGFQVAGPVGFTYGKPAFEPAFQARELEHASLAGRSGRVLFHPAFADAE